jgi:hypothetical protein
VIPGRPRKVPGGPRKVPKGSPHSQFASPLRLQTFRFRISGLEQSLKNKLGFRISGLEQCQKNNKNHRKPNRNTENNI